MDWKTFIIEIGKVFIWPITTFAIVFMVRKSIYGLLDGMRLKKLRRGDLEAIFDEAAQEFRQLTTSKSVTQVQARSGGLLEELKDTVEISPLEALFVAWNHVERSIQSYAQSHGVKERTLAAKLNRLVEKGVLPPSAKDALLGLSRLRNLAVHAPEGQLTSERAREFLEFADAALQALKREDVLSKGGQQKGS